LLSVRKVPVLEDLLQMVATPEREGHAPFPAGPKRVAIVVGISFGFNNNLPVRSIEIHCRDPEYKGPIASWICVIGSDDLPFGMIKLFDGIGHSALRRFLRAKRMAVILALAFGFVSEVDVIVSRV
jgi:hypothetical protein